MKVKKYVGPSMPQIMNTIRKELGSEAIILNSREVKRRSILGLFKKNKIEVIAALDPDPLPTTRKKILKTPSVSGETKTASTRTNQDVLMEVKQLRNLIVQDTARNNSRFLSNYQLIYQYLLDQEIDADLSEDLLDSAIEQQEEGKENLSANLIMHSIKKEIEKRLCACSFQDVTEESKIIHFVGPTGVGKTTTIAKIAAKDVLKSHKKVAFITTDTYRIAAVDQLKTYARILDIPLEVAYTAEDYRKAIKKFENYDIILVDTAGRNFRDDKYISELKNMIDFDSHVETFLVLSLTSKAKDITELKERFNDFPINRAIFTKLDETKQYGSILNMVLNYNIEIAYLTNGQEVPEDIIHPAPEEISGLILDGYPYE
ncbi:flagellar biosynthesis protein FlhF [Virgibacillus alimentarius]|uniref:flagellar biosynthesis protein FlhF n=1 Tax=Virgibacillus alimentarius TaxID=698769 RepID=UPI0004930C68|nr:flagellar biosynthesis protein FlhF [Virgibacillus alimentarius]